MNQTALISLQVPILSNNTRQKHTQRYTNPAQPHATLSRKSQSSKPSVTRKPAATPSNLSAAGERYLGNTKQTRKREIHESVTFSNLPEISSALRSNNAPD
jgi:hypothetical protein